MKRNPLAPQVSSALLLLSAVTIAGCSRPSGPQKYPLSGKVLYQGQPLPRGDLILAPDAEQQNEGPGSFCLIKDGQYATSADGGVVGGPYVLTITGYESAGEDSKPLFTDFQVKVDLPKQGSTHDIEIPDQAR